MSSRFRVDTVNGHHLLRGGVVPVSFLKRGQRWRSENHEVEITEIVDGWVTYSWDFNGTPVFHTKLSFPFQCRYHLVLDTPEVPKELRSAS